MYTLLEYKFVPIYVKNTVVFALSFQLAFSKDLEMLTCHVHITNWFRVSQKESDGRLNTTNKFVNKNRTYLLGK